MTENVRQQHDQSRQLQSAAFDLLESTKNLLAIAMLYYKSLPDDGTEQDHVMTYYIEPARIAIHKAERPEQGKLEQGN